MWTHMFWKSDKKGSYNYKIYTEMFAFGFMQLIEHTITFYTYHLFI